MKKTAYYGINVAKVREVIRVPETTDYPNAQRHMVGVFSLRDRLIPLVDLAGWLGIKTNPDPSHKVVIVTDFNKMANGFLIDSVSRIPRVSWEDVESPSQFLEAGENDCVVAVVRRDGNLIMNPRFREDHRRYQPRAQHGEVRRHPRSQSAYRRSHDGAATGQNHSGGGRLGLYPPR